MRTLLTVVTVVSNFPLFIMGLGVILLVVFIILICRSRQKRVSPRSKIVFEDYLDEISTYQAESWLEEHMGCELILNWVRLLCVSAVQSELRGAV